MNYKIIKPMIVELLTKDELIKRLKAENELNVADLKMVSSIIKVPRICTDFHKALRKKYDESRFNDLQKQITNQLIQEYKIKD